jgi:hypothetical protein
MFCVAEGAIWRQNHETRFLSAPSYCFAAYISANLSPAAYTEYSVYSSMVLTHHMDCNTRVFPFLLQNILFTLHAKSLKHISLDRKQPDCSNFHYEHYKFQVMFVQ